VYATSDCSGEPVDTITGAFGECKNPADGYSSKAVSCGGGVTVAHSFTTNDCSGAVDEVQTIPVTGECCDSEGNCQAAGGDSGADGDGVTYTYTYGGGDGGGATTVECTANGVTQKVYATSDCSGEPVDTITGAFGECKNPADGYSSKAVFCADGVTVAHTFTTNDCSGAVDEVQTVPVTGECCDSEGNCQASASQAPSGAVVATVETTVTLTATEDGRLDDAAAAAALAEELGVDAERITLVPSFDGALEAGAAAEVKVVVEVEDASAVEAVEEKLGALDGGETDVFGDSFKVTAVAAVVVTRPAPSPPPADDDSIGAALSSLTGLTLILVIALPIGGCCLTLCVVLIVVCICRQKAAADERSSVEKAMALLQRSSVAKAIADLKTSKHVDIQVTPSRPPPSRPPPSRPPPNRV
jgi:hypothetical protein